MSNFDVYKDDLEKLIKLGNLMHSSLSFQGSGSAKVKEFSESKRELIQMIKDSFDKDYQNWYSESCSVIRQLLPERLEEFELLYKGNGRRKKIDFMTFNIQDWLMGVRAEVDFMGDKPFDDLGVVTMQFTTQLNILKSAKKRFESRLFEIRQLVQADLLDSELDAARQLHKNGYLRASGVIAGVVLEAHLRQVCIDHALTMRKRSPGISDYNELLKSSDVIEVPVWRFIQRLGDLRNLCGHKKDREPEKDEIHELMNGVEKITKTVY